jgi:hypothetical protein
MPTSSARAAKWRPCGIWPAITWRAYTREPSMARATSFRLKFHQARLHLSGVPTPELLASRHFGLPPPVRSEQLMGIFPSPALVGNSTSLRGASFFLDADLPDGVIPRSRRQLAKSAPISARSLSEQKAEQNLRCPAVSACPHS